MSSEIEVTVKIPASDIPVEKFLSGKPPIDLVQLLKYLEAITDDEFREIRDFVGDEQFKRFARRCKGFGNRVHDLSNER